MSIGIMVGVPMERSLSTLSTPRPLPSVTERTHGLLEAPRATADGGIVVTGRYTSPTPPMAL